MGHNEGGDAEVRGEDGGGDLGETDEHDSGLDDGGCGAGNGGCDDEGRDRVHVHVRDEAFWNREIQERPRKYFNWTHRLGILLDY